MMERKHEILDMVVVPRSHELSNQITSALGQPELAAVSRLRTSNRSSFTNVTSLTSGSRPIDETRCTSEIDETSGTREIDEISGTSEIDETSGTSEIDETSGTSEIDDTSGTREIDETSGTSEIDETSETSEIDDTSWTSEIDETSGISEIDETSGTREIDEISGTSEIDETRGTDENSGTSENDETIGTSETGETDEDSEIVETSGVSELDETSGTSETDQGSGTREIKANNGTSETDKISGTSELDETSGTSEINAINATRDASDTSGGREARETRETGTRRGNSEDIVKRGPRSINRRKRARRRGTNGSGRRRTSKSGARRRRTGNMKGTSRTGRRGTSNMKGTSRTGGIIKRKRTRKTGRHPRPQHRHPPAPPQPQHRFRPAPPRPQHRHPPALPRPQHRFRPAPPRPQHRHPPAPPRPQNRFRPAPPRPQHRHPPAPPRPQHRFRPAPPRPQHRHPPAPPRPQHRFRPAPPRPQHRHPPAPPRPQHRFRPAPPQPPWDAVVSEAIMRADDEDSAMKLRLDAGIDKYARDFVVPDPLLFSESPENADAFSRQSRIINWMSRIVKERHPGHTLDGIVSHSAARDHGVVCPFRPPRNCPSEQRYRTVDGSCNNLQNPLWGAAFTPFKRTLPAVYEERNGRDDFPRNRSVTGDPLPNPRVVSTRFHEDALTGDDSIFSMLVTIYGQFLAHDITDRAPTKGSDQAVLKCCNQAVPTPHGKCANFQVPAQDFFRNYKRDCMEFPRSLEVTDVDCRHGSREQLNQASSFIDGGAVYGATKNKSDSLRRFKGGLMMVSVPQQLPIIPHGNTQATMQGYAFYAAGDNRVNEFIGLIAIETVWIREHNRIAKALARRHSDWDDERLYQETRRIIIAMIQHITFSEYLPAILGPDLVRKYELRHLVSGHYTGYDANHDPSLANSFATSAMRFGHSMLRTTYRLLNLQNDDDGNTPIDLKDTFFRPQTFLLHEDPLMRGMATHPSKICDRVLSSSVINNLYETNEGTGSDLAANNIQRERDHGLPSYIEWRRHFGLSVPSKFDASLQGFTSHAPDTVNRLSQLYKDVRDVDLFTAGTSEIPVRDGGVGPTFGNILGKQFKALKKGDRYWYETSEHPQAFTLEQLREIKKVTIAYLLCRTYNFERIQRRAFYNPDQLTNNLVPCSSIPSLNLEVF